jgi:hypothetical protein
MAVPMPVPCAHIGFATTVLESVATSVGAGMLLGGFVMGAVGVALGWDHKDLEERALRDGYIGGIAAVAFLIYDLARYIV